MNTVAVAYLKQFREFDDHQLVIQLDDSVSGLRGFIAIHNTRLGPAVGGTRLYAYSSQDEALADVLRLSRAMTYKCAVARVAHGGGKGVIIGNPTPENRKQWLKTYAEAVNKLKGQFFTGEDAGVSEADVQFMLQYSPYFIGKAGYAGDPSPFAALSTYYAIQAAVEMKLGKKDLRGMSVAVKGLGKVGSELAQLLLSNGARVIAAEINPITATEVKKRLPELELYDHLTIHQLSVEVFSPCALGNEFTDKTISEIKAPIICGAANNQLANEIMGDYLFEEGILYIPDYVANAGGLIDVVDELREGGFDRARVVAGVKQVRQTVTQIITTVFETQTSPHRVANQWAEEVFKK